jgi:hypothetical protein
VKSSRTSHTYRFDFAQNLVNLSKVRSTDWSIAEDIKICIIRGRWSEGGWLGNFRGTQYIHGLLFADRTSNQCVEAMDSCCRSKKHSMFWRDQIEPRDGPHAHTLGSWCDRMDNYGLVRMLTRQWPFRDWTHTLQGDATVSVLSCHFERDGRTVRVDGGSAILRYPYETC